MKFNAGQEERETCEEREMLYIKIFLLTIKSLVFKLIIEFIF